MPMKFAILLDAGLLKRKLGSSSNPMDADLVVEFTDKIQKRDELKDCIAYCTAFTTTMRHL